MNGGSRDEVRKWKVTLESWPDIFIKLSNPLVRVFLMFCYLGPVHIL